MPTDEERYLNLAGINIGEALITFHNLRQRDVRPGSGTREVQLSLMRAISALRGELYTAPPNEIDARAEKAVA